MAENFPDHPLPSRAQEEFILIRAGDQAADLAHSIVVPRPIALVTSINEKMNVNAAPFSQFNIVAYDPLILSLSIQRRNGELKETARNILQKRSFVIHICSFRMAKRVSLCSKMVGPLENKINLAGFTLIPSTVISTPRIAETLIQMECTLYQDLEVGNDRSILILGEVAAIHLHVSIFKKDGSIDLKKLDPLARVGKTGYAQVGDCLDIPGGV